MLRRTLLVAVAFAVAASALALGAPAKPKPSGSYAWQDRSTGAEARLRGLSAVSASVVWTSGATAAGGVVFRTLDGGATWQNVSPPNSAGLQFRDIEAFDANRAVAMSAGEGPNSRIYVTDDGGANWTLSFVNEEPLAFYDCMTFFDDRRGLALSDPPDGVKFRIISTSDGGHSWRIANPSGMPPALPGEFAFAASGQCLTGDQGHRAWFGTGGGAQARVFRSNNRGQTWTVAPTPIASSPSSGIFALAFRNQQHGIAVGGDFAAPEASPNNFASTRDGGSTWQLLTGAPAEYRSGATWVDGHTAIAVGPSGSNVSTDFGMTWTEFDSGSLDTIDCASPVACWASGANGRVAYLTR